MDSKEKDTAAKKKPIIGLRTFASDRAALEEQTNKSTEQSPKEENTTATTVAGDTTDTETVPAPSPEPVPQAAPIKVHESVTKLDQQGDQIPAFHELSKTTGDKTPKTTIAIEDTDGAFGATIISDTKRKRFKLFPAIAQGLRTWWKGITTPRKKKINTYALPDSSLRKGVIQKATSKTGTIFTADSETLRERIKARNKTQADKKHNEPTSHTTWSPNTESGYDLLDAPDEQTKPSNVSVAFKKHTTPSSIQKTEAAAPAPKPTLDQKPTPASELEPMPVQPPKPEPTPTPEPAANPTPEAAPAPKPAPKPKRKPRRRRANTSLLTLDTNLLTVGIVAVVIALLVLFFATKFVLSIVMPTVQTETIQTNNTQSVLGSAPLRVMQLTDFSVQSIQDAIVVAQSTTGNSLQEIQFVLSDGSPLSSARFLSIIGAEVEADFAQTITDVRLAVSNEPTRGVLLAVGDPTTARGGMLLLEDSLYSTFADVFGSNLGASTTERFVDEQIEPHDTRVLYANDGSARIVYGFIDDNTILIAPNQTQFRAILNHK